MAKSKPLPFPAKCGFFTVVAVATACGSESHTDFGPPVPVDIHIERLDRDLFAMAPDSNSNFHLKLYAQYGSFYKDYVERVLQVGPVEDQRIPIALTGFVLDPDWSRVQAHADSVLGEMTTEEAEFRLAFGRLKNFFPDEPVPRIVAFNSGFNYGLIPTDSVLGIGVEWFTSKDHEVVKLLPPETFPQYMKDRMRPELLVPSAMKAWLLVHHTKDTRGQDVLTNLVEMGKTMYLLDAALPEVNPALKFAFTDAQLKWCEDNEFRIWTELVSKELLYSKKPEDVDMLLNDGPFTHGFPRESPGHLGEWIGFRMMQSYVSKNSFPRTMKEYMDLDPKQVLQFYKPR
jgi:hypothetical protein